MNIKKIILWLIIPITLYSIFNNAISNTLKHKGDNIGIKDSSLVYTSNYINSISHDTITNFELLNENGIVTCMDTVLHGKNKLLFVYSEENCMMCIEHYFRLINHNFEMEQVVVLTDYQNFRALRFIRKRLNVPYNFYIKRNNSCSKLDSLKTPSISVITKNKTIEYIHYPQLDKENEYQSYLNIYEKFLN